MKNGNSNRIKIILLVLCIGILAGIAVTNIYIYKKDPGQEATTVVTKNERINQSVSKQKDQQATEGPKQTEGVQATKKPEDTTVHNVSLLAVGDDLIHTQVIASGKKSNGSLNYDHLYKNVKSDVKKADIAVINQETVLGGKSLGYSGYPRFNSPTEIGDAVVKVGFNVVLHATNHSMDQGEKGLQNSLDYWKTKKGVTVLGANETEKEYNSVKVIEKNGIKIAMLNYTYGLNGLSLPKGREYMVDLLEKKKVKSDIAKAKKQADFVVVFPHWGTEYTYKPTAYQRDWTEIFSEAGVDLVIGAHPHVIEPVEWVTNSKGHRMLVYYSLGNFVSGQTEPERMLGGMAQVTITKKGNGEATISKAAVIPTVTHYNPSNSQYTVYKLSDYTKKLADSHRLRRKGLSVSKLKSLAKQVFGDWYQK